MEIDTGSGYQNFGTTEFKAVPYAKYAEKAGNVFSGDFGDLSNVPAGLSDGDDDTHLTDAQIASMGYIKNANDADHDATNELQTLTLSSTQLSISNGNNVNFTGWDTDASDDFSGDYNDLTNKPVLFYVGSTTNPASDTSQDIRRNGKISVGHQFAGANTDALIRANSNSTSNDDIQGFGAAIAGNGSGEHSGVTASLLGAGTGDQYAGKFNILNSGDGTHVGISTVLSGNGSGYHYGVNNYLTGSGSGAIYGTRNYIRNTGDGPHYGSYSRIEGHGSSWQAGFISWIYGDASGNNYGVKNLLTGAGSGNKYGTYNIIDPTAGGTHYAVVGSALKPGSYAGYFEGDVYVTKKLKGHDSGDADMKAYIYGNITYNGNKRTAGCSDGFNISKTATGTYEITFASAGNTYAYSAIASIGYGAGIGFIRTYNVSATKLIIYTYDKNGNFADKAFTFVVYKK